MAGGIEELLEVGRRFESIGGRNPALLAWRSQAALALLHLGDQDEARRLAAEELELARTWGAPRALARPCAPRDSSRAAQRDSHCSRRPSRSSPTPRCGSSTPRHAPTWERHYAAQTTAPRRANSFGRRSSWPPSAAPPRSPPAPRPNCSPRGTAPADLPQRHRVADPQRTTRRRAGRRRPHQPEIAQALFITTRTVEVHLTSSYRKLGINSRSQLAAILTQPAPA